MLAPGFVVRELPVKLSNINNLRFDPSGRLTALGYDGRVHLLRDTDGDGLEDQGTLFWDKTTLSVPVGMAWSKEGLYVTSHGKVSLLRDTDGDGKADVEEITASGWPPTDVGSGGVDATAVVLDSKGDLFFGLLTADYSNPYRVKEGVSRYELQGRRGTIQKWSTSDRQLQTVATGIRVPYTLAFNRAGDLFVTDQEGETWCPGGNPLDELNHIILGRNYGFPPRHDQYLPGLISEPPVVAFGPQHQSTCGLTFNESHPGQKLFGPAWWEGDALVAGESRGKIWRSKLFKTPAGYLGKEVLVARLNRLTTDVAISPRGILYVSCHSGAPDWGTGPQGIGQLFQITYADATAPQPVSIWPSGAMELRVSFDRPVDPSVTNYLNGMAIEFGDYVSAADRLEVLKPPYKTVQDQETTPRGKLRVAEARLAHGHRTLVLTTDPHPQSVNYALTLPGIKAAGSPSAPATVDLSYDLNGVDVKWFEQIHAANTTNAAWSGWLPHVDWQVGAAFTTQESELERLTGMMKRQGRLQIQTRLFFHANHVLVRIEDPSPFSLLLGTKTIEAQPKAGGRHAAEWRWSPAPLPELLTILLKTGSIHSPELRATYSTDLDATERPIPFGSFLLPWAPWPRPPAPPPPQTTELAGGDYERGRDLFTSERLKCATCHRLRGEGSLLGPDLSNLVHRDPSSVLRDILEPHLRINPDYVAYHIGLRDGSELTGFVRTQGAGSLRLIGADGKEQFIKRETVTSMNPSAASLMPSGLLEGLPEPGIRDLMTYLVNEPPKRSPAESETVNKARKE